MRTGYAWRPVSLCIQIVLLHNNNNNNIKTLLKLHNKILTEIKRNPKEHSNKLLSFKISFSIKHGILI